MSMRKIKPKSMNEMDGMPMSGKAMIYPTVHFDTTTLPEAKDWKIGQTYELNLEIKMTGISQRKGPDGKETGYADFDVVSIEPGEIVKGKGGKKVARYTELNTKADENEAPGE